MDAVEQNYYELALDLFEQCRYAEAVENFIKSYQCGWMQEEIIQILYDCFITPNEAEFRKNYEENQKGLTTMDYSAALIDFIPVSDTEYYLWHKEKREFLSAFRLEEKSTPSDEVEFESLLIADVWDIRLVLENMRARNWNMVYFVLNEQKEAFFSFLKLPGFSELYLQNALCFNCTEEMQLFFQTYSDYYIPRKVMAFQTEIYIDLLSEIHEQRIKDMQTPRNNIYLSVCIPSWNRGHIALETVRNILNCEYDSEIEIVISDNGSTKNTEGYKELSRIQDSRVHYVRVEENQGYAANVCNVLKHARGKFLVLCSDEDTMRLQELYGFLKFLINHEYAGVIYSSGIGPNFVQEEAYVVESIYQSVECAMNTNYLTGVTINGEIFRKYDLLEEFQKLRNNMFVDAYAHSSLAVLACKKGCYANSGINLWLAWVDAADHEVISKYQDNLDEPPLHMYMRPEVRIEQLNTALELIEYVLGRQAEGFITLLFNRVWKTYYLVNIAYESRPNRFQREYCWEEICSMIHENDKLLMERYNADFLKESLDKLYHDWLQNKPYEKEK